MLRLAEELAISKTAATLPVSYDAVKTTRLCLAKLWARAIRRKPTRAPLEWRPLPAAVTSSTDAGSRNHAAFERLVQDRCGNLVDEELSCPSLRKNATAAFSFSDGG